MKREIITINENGAVIVPDETKMSIGEISDLFGIYYPTAKKYIRAIEKSGIASGDYSMCCTVEGLKVYPEYYGLEMIIALSFRVQSPKAEIFRKWAVKKITELRLSRTIMLSMQNSILNWNNTNIFN